MNLGSFLVILLFFFDFITQMSPFTGNKSHILSLVVPVCRCGGAPSPGCDTGGWERPSSSCGPTGTTRSGPTSARSTTASKTSGPWRTTAGTWSGRRPRRSCASLKRPSGASTTGNGDRVFLKIAWPALCFWDAKNEPRSHSWFVGNPL